jgi:hypothetical protein
MYPKARGIAALCHARTATEPKQADACTQGNTLTTLERTELDNLRFTLIAMAYGLALWLALAAVVVAIWVSVVKYTERCRRTKFARAWNEWMGFQ